MTARNFLKRRGLAIVIGSMLAAMTGLVIYAPTLYQMFCNLTGYGGTVQRAAVAKAATVAGDQKVTVYFDANVAPGLPWEFRPMQRKVETHFGEPTRVNYFARNTSDEPVIARATFNITPAKAAQYFFKIECFCFTEEKLGPGESAEMPLVLYIDEQLLKDRNTEEVRDITLSYTFFRQKDLPPEKVAGARDLKAGSEQLDAKLKQSEKVEFENDAPRRR